MRAGGWASSTGERMPLLGQEREAEANNTGCAALPPTTLPGSLTNQLAFHLAQRVQVAACGHQLPQVVT